MTNLGTFTFIWNGTGKILISSSSDSSNFIMLGGTLTITNLINRQNITIESGSDLPPINLNNILDENVENSLSIEIASDYHSALYLIKCGGTITESIIKS